MKFVSKKIDRQASGKQSEQIRDERAKEYKSHPTKEVAG
jgi:hypothetical protein